MHIGYSKETWHVATLSQRAVLGACCAGADHHSQATSLGALVNALPRFLSTTLLPFLV